MTPDHGPLACLDDLPREGAPETRPHAVMVCTCHRLWEWRYSRLTDWWAWRPVHWWNRRARRQTRAIRRAHRRGYYGREGVAPPE